MKIYSELWGYRLPTNTVTWAIVRAKLTQCSFSTELQVQEPNVNSEIQCVAMIIISLYLYFADNMELATKLITIYV